jgi:hypothetical protein
MVVHGMLRLRAACDQRQRTHLETVIEQLAPRELCHIRRDWRDIVRIMLHLSFAPVADPSSVRIDSKASAKRRSRPGSTGHSLVVNALPLFIVA